LADPARPHQERKGVITRIDLAGIKENIDQIWAEAVAAYRDQEPWWFTEELELVAAEEQAARLEADPWLPLIAEFVETLDCVTTSAVLGECLHVEKARRERPHQMRVGNILRSLGFERKRQSREGKREYLYCRIEEAAPAPEDEDSENRPAAKPLPTGNSFDRDGSLARCAQGPLQRWSRDDKCPVCGSRRAACPTLAAATRIAGMWCPLLENALDKAPSRSGSRSCGRSQYS
jgi:predicted P-loop ATPase